MSWQALAAGIQLRIALMSVGLSSICPHTTAHDHVDITMAVSISSASAIKRNLPTKGAGVLGICDKNADPPAINSVVT